MATATMSRDRLSPAARTDHTVPSEITWEREYETLLERALVEGNVQRREAPEERRGHPRFQLRSGTIGVQFESQFPVVNVSISGVCFLSPFRLLPGQTLNLVLAKAFRVEVQVVACDALSDGESPLAGEAAAGNWPWRVHCGFTHHSEGLRMLVMLNAMDNLVLCPHGS